MEEDIFRKQPGDQLKSEEGDKINSFYTKWNRIRTSSVFLYVIVSLLMLVIFFLIYGVYVLNPFYVDWLMSGGDLSQHYLGWRGYRISEWIFPIGNTNSMAYPVETSVIFTDSIPIFAVLFKLLSPVLPENFQYFGWGGAACYVLQGILSVKIMKNFTESRIFIIFVSILFAFMPGMMYRMFGHSSLAGHWILLLALEPIFAYHKYIDGKKIFLIWAGVAALAVSTHTYFLMMCGIILVGFCLEDILYRKNVVKSLILLIEFLTTAIVVTWILGGFSSGFAYKGDGLGDYSMNINALFNPQGWSHLLKDMPLYGSRQYEGFTYLGAGCILLLFFSAVAIATNSNIKEYIKKYYVQICAVSFIFVVAFLFALSPKITYGDRLIYELKLPDFLIQCWQIFRSTGRFGWICAYILLICSCIACCKFFNRRAALMVLVICLFVQIYDIQDLIKGKKATYNQVIGYDSFLQDEEFWDLIGSNGEICHIVFTQPPAYQEMFTFADWAFSNNKTINYFYFAHGTGDFFEKNLQESLMELSASDLFVFFDSNKMQCQDYNLHYYMVDGFIIGYCKELSGFEELKDLSVLE